MRGMKKIVAGSDHVDRYIDKLIVHINDRKIFASLDSRRIVSASSTS